MTATLAREERPRITTPNPTNQEIPPAIRPRSVHHRRTPTVVLLVKSYFSTSGNPAVLATHWVTDTDLSRVLNPTNYPIYRDPNYDDHWQSTGNIINPPFATTPNPVATASPETKQRKPAA